MRYNYDRTKRTLIATGCNIRPDHRDDKKRWVKRACPQFEEIDSLLTKITSKLDEILTYAKDNGIDPTVDFVLLELEKNREYEQRSNRVNMFDTLDLYIEEKKGKVSAEELMKISGHKSPAAFMRYIKVDNIQAANRLKELRATLK